MIEVYGISELYQRHVAVYSPEVKMIASVGEVWFGKRKTINLLFTEERKHYDALVDGDWDPIKHTISREGIYEDERINLIKYKGPNAQIKEFRDLVLERDPVALPLENQES